MSNSFCVNDVDAICGYKMDSVGSLCILRTLLFECMDAHQTDKKELIESGRNRIVDEQMIMHETFINY